MTGPDSAPPDTHRAAIAHAPLAAAPIVIIGMSLRVPGATTLTEFWRMLLAGHDATRSGRDDSAAHARRGGFLTGIEEFDNDWFAISEREAAAMDPQQRLALEVAVEAIDDAGIGYRTRGSDAAVVFGACGYDHGITTLGGAGRDAAYAVTGSAMSIIANRVSYALDLHGPSLVVDSACSSSLAALDYAARLLAEDSVPFAIVGGVNLTLLPYTSNYLAEGGFLAPDGRVKPFDAAADGYTRGEGCGVVILQRAEAAIRAGHRVYAQITGTAVGSDGRSNGLYAPNGRAQQQTVRTAWARAGLAPSSAVYIECHGTGTALGDAVEVAALATALRGERVEPIAIGSVKSNIGHLEAAAGVTGLIKTALVLHHGAVPPTANFRQESPLLKLTERGLRVPTEAIDLTDIPADERMAGVSSFGFGGTNAHVALRGFSNQTAGTEFPALLPVTGRDHTQLRAQAERIAHQLDTAATKSTSAPILEDVTCTELISGTARLLPEEHRVAIVGHDTADIVRQLHAVARSAPHPAPLSPGGTRRRGGLLFLFAGQGGQHAAMGATLAARYPIFACALDEAARAVADAGGPQVSATSGREVSTALIQPALFAFQYAVTALLAAWGVRPDAVAGHSLGEVAAAAACGALTLPDAARVAVLRSRALAALDGKGAMAMLEATAAEATTLVEPMRTEVGIAAINGPRTVVVSGSPRYIDTLVRRAKRRKLFATRIAVDFAAHSPQVDAVAPELQAALDGLRATAPSVPMYSATRRGHVLTTATTDAVYWTENIAGTVELTAALDRAADDGFSTVVEIGPHPVLTSAVREHPVFGAEGVHPATDRDDEVHAFLRCLGALYTEGRPVDWSQQGPLRSPPARQWRKRKFPLLDNNAPAPVTPAVDKRRFSTEDLSDHVVHGVPLVPAMYWLRRLLHLAQSDAPRATLADLVVHERSELGVLPEVSYHRNHGELRAEIAEGTALLLASARAGSEPTTADIVAWMRVVDANRAARHHMRVLPTAAFYAELRTRSLAYGPRFRVLRGIAAATDRALGLLDSADPQHTATLDGCLHLLAAAHDELPRDAVALPIAVDGAWISGTEHSVVVEAHAVIRTRTSTGLLGDVIGTDQHGAPCLAMTGVHIRFVGIESLARQTALPGGIEVEPAHDARELAQHNIFHTECWVPCEAEAPSPRRDSTQPAADRALVVGESTPAVALARALERTVPTERVARDPDAADAIVASLLATRPATIRTALALVWPHGSTELASMEPGDSVAVTVSRVVQLIQQTQRLDCITSLTVVLPTGAAPIPLALAALVRSLQLESGRTVRLLWSDGSAENQALLTDSILGTDAGTCAQTELRLTEGSVAVRRFRPAGQVAAGLPEIDPAGTYVVTGGLGALGSVAVRWLLDAGARDVVVLTRGPRPVPPLLDGLEHRIVVVRCDCTDRGDLANALNDIREYGSAIRGIVHAAGTLVDAPFEAVTPTQIRRLFAAKLTAAQNLIELSAPDPTQFVLLFSSATGAVGAPGQSAYAAANAAMDALASDRPNHHVLSIGWGVWDSGLAEAAGGAAHLRRAGVAAFDPSDGAALLNRLVRFDGYVMALDYTPTTDTSALSGRLTRLLAAEKHPAGASTAPAAPHRSPIPQSGPAPDAEEPLTATIRRILARTLDLPADRVDPNTDFNELGLTSLLAIEVRRNLEAELHVRISTAELFQHATVTAFGAALADRVRTTTETSP